jgi:hypothetical protein
MSQGLDWRSLEKTEPMGHTGKSGVTLDEVWRLGLALRGVERSTAYGSPALKVKGKLLACVPTHKTADPGSLMFRVGRQDRPALLAEAPDLYYAPDHYLLYDGVLVRLDRLTPELAHDLLVVAHRFVTREPGTRDPG